MTIAFQMIRCVIWAKTILDQRGFSERRFDSCYAQFGERTEKDWNRGTEKRHVLLSRCLMRFDDGYLTHKGIKVDDRAFRTLNI